MDTEHLLNDLNIDTAVVNQGVLHFNDTTTALNGDASLINEDQYAELNRWKDEIINIAIIGQSRQGKSSFINALCGEEVAAVGDLAPTTMEIQKVANTDFPNCVFWDLPGIDGIKFKRETYFDDIKLQENNYDVYIIVTKEMLGDGELFVAKELVARGKLFYLVRTHVDEKVAKLVKKQKVSENDAVAEIRKLLMTQLNESGFDQELHKIFLVNVEEPFEAMQYFDMALFVETICRRGFASQTKASAFLFSIKIRGPQMVQEMYSQLRKRIKVVATASAAGGAQPIPGVGMILDAKLIYDEIKLYLEKFNLTKVSIAETEKKAHKEPESIEKMVVALLSSKNGAISLVREQNHWFSTKNLHTQVLLVFLKSLGLVVLSESVEGMMKVTLPIVGLAAAGGLSFVTTLIQLEIILRSARNVALEVQKWIGDKSLDKDPDPFMDPDFL
ncbi:interferon-inducible GTPase 5-like [Symsagittifera roscoffensis]|uniref:interferon-inducible GTPase 5-like n=1 Tax=Symsagittifera roscoffensis TaxID=84072 RepID=UPI00307B51EA